MFFVLRYIFIFSLFGLIVIFFNIFVYFHVFSQIFLSFLDRQFNDIPQNYDYIIVGSGTAGSILAYRLAQDENNKILLLEAGPYSNFLFDVPALTPMLQKTYLDWQYETLPQKYACKGLENNVSFWPMGKIFGGTHRLNNMIYIRGHKNDFDEWFSSKIDYNYKQDVLYYFKKSENLMDMNSGLLNVGKLNFVSHLSDAILEAAEFLKISTNNLDPNSGFMKPQITSKQNKRWTTSHSLLAENFKNLRILTNALVHKIVFKNDLEASGVQYNILGDIKLARAKKAVIICAGVIGTPKLLLLSGIGPPKHLNNVKIRPRKNLPVGENLQDHITTGFDLITLNQTLNINIESLLSPISVLKYFFYNSGPWISPGCEAIGFCHINSNKPGHKPDLQFMVLPTGVSADGGKILKSLIGIKQSFWDEYFAKLIRKQTISILPVILRPSSRGKVRLQSSNPNLKPIIDPNYLSNKNDIKILIEGINIVKKLIQTPSLQKLGAKLNHQPIPGCANHRFDSNEYWECYVRHLTLTSYHPVGTCRMGSAGSLNSVVDYNFKVIGLNKLFVVDGSVLPSLPSGNPNSVIAMMAERAADVIKYEKFLNEGSCRIYDIWYEIKMCLK